MIQNKYKILLVEDEKNIRNLVATMLETEGYQIIHANSCSSAKTMFNSYLPEFVILDLGLPDADGMNFLEFVRKDSLVPIIVLSARTNELDKIIALDGGAMTTRATHHKSVRIGVNVYVKVGIDFRGSQNNNVKFINCRVGIVWRSIF